MRTSRLQKCPEPNALVHQYWKCHNQEMLLKHYENKALYSLYTQCALRHKSVKRKVQIHAFCYMDNHVHLLCSYQNGVKHLSNFMRYANGCFGLALNQKLKRKGKVAIERPHTPMVQDNGKHDMNVHMYIEANPIRAEIVKTPMELKKIKTSSYAFYAYGEINEFTKNLTPPTWYIKLGRSPKARQRKYRRLFVQYLDTNGWFGKKGNRRNTSTIDLLKDQGSRAFILKRKLFVATYNNYKKNNKNLSPKEILELIYRNRYSTRYKTNGA